jgi:hypothetical protein
MTLRTTGASMIVTLLTLACSEGDSEMASSTLTDPEGYTVAVPAGWDVQEHFQEGALIRADLTNGDDMGIQIRLTDVSLSNFSTTSQILITDYADDMSSHQGGDFTEIGRDAPVAGDEAITARFHASRADGQQWYLQISLVRRGILLVMFQCGCPWEDRQEGKAAFDATVESIRFDQ